MQTAPAPLPSLQPGCFWGYVNVSHAVLPVECRWEEMEDDAGNVLSRIVVIESVMLGDALVRASKLSDAWLPLLELWAEEVEADERDKAQHAAEASAADAYREKLRAFSYYGAMARAVAA